MSRAQEFTSPDGKLVLYIETTEDGDRTIGFRGHPWHTHADLLSKISGLSEEMALNKFVKTILNDEAVIALMSHDGKVKDIWICDNPESAIRYREPGEELQFRYWSGRELQFP